MKVSAKPRLLIAAPGPQFVRAFLADQLALLVAEGFEVLLVCAPGEDEGDRLEDLPCPVTLLPIARSIRIGQDTSALWRLVRVMRKWQPDLIHSHGPKAGLLGSLAAWIAAVPIRLHTIHGLRSDGLTGIKQYVVRSMERLTVCTSTRCFAVSRSLMQHVIDSGIAAVGKIEVLGEGSWAGISLAQFDPSTQILRATVFRTQHGIGVEAPVVSYIGRLARDKGIEVLAEAWRYVEDRHPNARLIVAGPPDASDPVSPRVLQELRSSATVLLIENFIEEVPVLLAASDIFVQPSFREGLGVGALEASAMELPVVASRITGLIDAVLDHRSGHLVPPANALSLADALNHLIDHPGTRKHFGATGRRLVETTFARKNVLAASLRMYREFAEDDATESFWCNWLKRPFDLLVSGLLLLCCAPVLLLIAIAIAFSMGRPIFFTQQRGGLHGHPFRLIKFRTMHQPDVSQAMIGTDHLRTHWLGNRLRALSLDELPQLLNVLLGHMSLIGPRPLLVEYLSRYNKEQARRHDVRPGITGWAQVHGRNAVSWEERFILDRWYVRHRGFLTDIQILLLTLRRLLLPSGINSAGLSSMPEFVGTTDSFES